ncbi:hypothetical protein FACS189427_12570 [Planctomycetales bacterium]|nr:hypothetical protein FACS189427_12570 [Planctomycetales bacterium]
MQTSEVNGTVCIDVFYIRITPQQRETLQKLWQETDEMILDASFRYKLRREGLRFGILGDILSAPLSELINVTGEAQNTSSGIVNEVSVNSSAINSNTVKHSRNLYPGMSASLPPFDSDVSEMTRFWMEDGKICGKTYQDARGIIRLSAQITPDRKARFQIVPELEYGNIETKIKTHAHILSLESGKPRYIFDDLTIKVDLIPGQWFIIGPSAANCSGIGRDFFMREDERNEFKIIAVRLIRMKSGQPQGKTELPIPAVPANTESTGRMDRI